MATGDAKIRSNGKAVDVNLLYTVGANELAVVDGFLGIAGGSGDSGDTIALNYEQQEYQLEIPGTLSVAKGDELYIEVADVTGHTPDSTAYGTSSGAGKVRFGRATSAHYTGASGNRIVNIIFLPN